MVKKNKTKKGVKIPKVGRSHLTDRSPARFDESEFLNDLNNAPFDKVYNHTDPHEVLATWYSVFLKVLDKHATQKKRRIKYSFKPGWLTLEVLDAMRYRDYLLKLKLFDEHEKQRNKVIYIIRDSPPKCFAEIKTAIRALKDQKAAGPGGLIGEFYKNSTVHILPFLVLQFHLSSWFIS